VELCILLEFLLISIVVIIGIFEYRNIRVIMKKVNEIKGEIMYIDTTATLKQIIIIAKSKEQELLIQENEYYKKLYEVDTEIEKENEVV